MQNLVKPKFLRNFASETMATALCISANSNITECVRHPSDHFASAEKMVESVSVSVRKLLTNFGREKGVAITQINVNITKLQEAWEEELLKFVELRKKEK